MNTCGLRTILSERLRRALVEREPAASGPSVVSPSSAFSVTFELVPGRASRGRAYEKILAFAKDTAHDGRICALSITDNAGGHPALSPGVLGQEIRDLGMEAVIHFSCKDQNRNQIESRLFELDRYCLTNLLVVTGDYPRYGFEGQSKPVFDLDSVHVLGLIADMNRGYFLDPRAPGGGLRLPPTNFFAGCVVSPFKRLEAELRPQYAKLERKIAAGAGFVITQIGFDVRKYDEVRRYFHYRGHQVPLLGTVFIPNVGLARALNQGVVPGCILPDALLAKIEAEAGGSDLGHGARLERGARLVAVLKGLGYEGIHLSGVDLRYSDVAHVLDRAREIGDDWQDLVPEFLFPEEWDSWYFEKDRSSGLNSLRPAELGKAHLRYGVAFGFAVDRMVHRLAFEHGAPLYRPMAKLARGLHKSVLEGAFTTLEYWMKGVLFDCQRCGDCTLDEMGFLCPQSGCAKCLLNGPCGGSRDGWCEVWPGKRRCLYVLSYERLRAIGGDKALYGPPIPPRDWSLYRESSWLTFFLGMDHHGRDR